MVSHGEIALWSLERGDALSCPERDDPLGILAVSVIDQTCWAQTHGTACSYSHLLVAVVTNTISVQHSYGSDL